MASSNNNLTKPTKDEEFELTVEMMVDDFDDERTLDEEERLAAVEQVDPQDELKSLQNEGNMPIDQLLAMYYGGNMSDCHKNDPSTETEYQHKSFTAEEDVKKTIHVGKDHQAFIPEEFLRYDDVLPYENCDLLVWDPSKISEATVVEYLKTLDRLKSDQPATNPNQQNLRDDEQALYVLQQCGYNVEEALRRRKILNANDNSISSMNTWSEDECRNFESGLRMYGKDFHQIHVSKVKTRNVGEIIQFYYLWKKTERYDLFANKTRINKKKYNLNPGLTDFMDKFLEDQETTSSSYQNIQLKGYPASNSNSLLQMSNTKRHLI